MARSQPQVQGKKGASGEEGVRGDWAGLCGTVPLFVPACVCVCARARVCVCVCVCVLCDFSHV